MYDFFSKNFMTISIVFIVLMIILPIVIMSINAKLVKCVENRNTEELEKYIKVQKGLIWANFGLIFVLSAISLIINIIFSRSNSDYLRRNYVMFERTFIYWGIAFEIILTLSLTIYMNHILDNVNIMNGSDELGKIYIIIPIMTVVSLHILLFIDGAIKNTFRGINYVAPFVGNTIQSITRSPVSSHSRSNSPSVSQFPRDRRYRYWTPTHLDDDEENY